MSFSTHTNRSITLLANLVQISPLCFVSVFTIILITSIPNNYCLLGEQAKSPLLRPKPFVPTLDRTHTEIDGNKCAMT